MSRSRVAILEVRLPELASPGSETTAALNAQRLETTVIGVRGTLDHESRSDTGAAAEAYGGVKRLPDSSTRSWQS